MAGVPAPAAGVNDTSALRRKPGLMPWLVLTPLLAWLVIFVVVPTIMLVILSFGTQSGLGTVHFTPLTIDNYENAFKWTSFQILIVPVGYAHFTKSI